MKTPSSSSLSPLRGLALGLLSFAVTFAAPALTPAESTSLLFMKQEEKMAHDVYQALGARWNHPSFLRIAQAEQRHMEVVDGLIARSGLADTAPAEPGRFSIPELQKLHDELLAQGGTSLAEAWRVGVKIEETDIADLQVAIAVAQDPSIDRVFGNLARASGHHLSAFRAALAVLEGTAPAVGASPDCPRSGACAVPGSGGGCGVRGQGRGNGGAQVGAGECPGACSQDGVCAATGCGAKGGRPNAPVPPSAGAQRRGRR